MDFVLCSDATPNLFAFFDLTIAPNLLYYAYIPIVLISLLLSGFVMVRDSYSLRGVSLFGLSAVFSLFLLNEIVLWTAIPAGFVVFGWSLALLLRSLFLISLILFTYAFLYTKPLPFQYLAILSTFLAPILLLLPTELSVRKFNLPYCEGISGYLWQYEYFIEGLTLVIFLVWFASFIRHYLQTKNSEFLQGAQLTGSVTVLLVLFSATEIYGETTGYYEITLLGPIGMLFFIVTLAYLIVNYRAFNIKLAAAQALVVGIIALVGSQLFFVESLTNYFLVSLTLVFTIIGSYLLVRSVKREIAQREQLQKLTEQLARANKRLRALDKAKSEFVSIASHQLRSPLTAMRGYASMLLEGSFGQIPQKARDAVARIADSTKVMSSSVEDYLNVSRIESGNMKYELSDFNFRERAERIADDKRQEAIRQGLLLLFKTNLTSTGVVHADVGKTEQIIHNLINNAMKYTPKGSITVTVRDDVLKKKIYLEVSDTGVGMSQETIGNLFGKFSRAANANQVNTGGTGLGLFVAKSLAQGMKGDVTAASTGEGQGSTFTLELPLQM